MRVWNKTNLVWVNCSLTLSHTHTHTHKFQYYPYLWDIDHFILLRGSLWVIYLILVTSKRRLQKTVSYSFSFEQILYILEYKTHFSYSKIEYILCAGDTKRESNIWHDLGGNTIILFFNINNEHMNNKLP